MNSSPGNARWLVLSSAKKKKKQQLSPIRARRQGTDGTEDADGQCASPLSEVYSEDIRGTPSPAPTATSSFDSHTVDSTPTPSPEPASTKAVQRREHDDDVVPPTTSPAAFVPAAASPAAFAPPATASPPGVAPPAISPLLIDETRILSQPRSAALRTVSFLGEGGYGRVTLVCDRTTHRLYALKTVRKAHLLAHRPSIRCKWTRREVEVLRMIEHPFIVHLHGSYASAYSVSLLLSAALGGDLYRLLDDAGTLDDATARFYTASATLAIGHLHRRGVVYRDLKLENILLDAQGFIKLCDFGFARAIGKCGGRTFTRCGTDDYMSPELLLGHGVSYACDWWALGVLLYEVLHGFPPFTDTESDRITHRNILRGVITYAPGSPASPDARSIIAALCTSTEADRLGSSAHVHDEISEEGNGGAEQVQAHTWFGADFDWVSLVNLTVQPPWRPPLKSALDTSFFDAEGSLEQAGEASAASSSSPSHELLEEWMAVQRVYKGGEALDEMTHL